MAKTKEVMAAEAGVVILVETKEDKVDGMVAMDKTKEVVVVMEEERFCFFKIRTFLIRLKI